ncbi:MAG TPA: GNAT family N-acetyltransferase [Allosphingosinicella sp.]|jgi:RimJ/RimL family protein N-acetyltransferase
MTDIPTIETERLILRGQKPGDTEALIAAFADDDYARFITSEKRGLDPVEAWRVVSLVAGSWATMGYGQWIAEERATGLPVGRLGPWGPPYWPDFEIGWSIFPGHQGKGFAREGAAAAMVWAHEAMGRDHAIHLIDPANVASERVAIALGAEPTGRWTVPGGYEVPVWTTRWEDFIKTSAFQRHVAA